MRREKIYLDTSVISAYNDLREPEKIKQTKEFLSIANKDFLYVSDLVKEELIEIKNSDRRDELNELIEAYTSFTLTDEIRELGKYYISEQLIPDTHLEDALHLAIATVNCIDILVSWNYTHLVKMKTRHLVNALNLIKGYKEIEIIPPIEY